MLLVSDANILIDLIEGRVVAEFLSLPDEIATPDLLFEEELADHHGELLGMGLNLAELSGDQIQRAEELVGNHPKASRNDCLALTLAETENCTLLTGDRALRQAADALRVEIHGTIWCVQRMIDSGRITPVQAREAYRRMRLGNSRLPWDEVNAQLAQYGLELPR
ncbi:DUF3368 domain-containing protein [Natronospira bacteriovora]|uniref:DUF3368 domain-containing protein n=1 Tax=Natronospira bacteriovora TaxID=3069753 RepID=A0ABU0W4Q0_9GAMM|nr:DUF3368 domain-containing protein [Natronospira sp. AB-CW4]MDQ2068989.1 DUF3368 domain-containing protein [Natronospira sp. AB-CW4]